MKKFTVITSLRPYVIEAEGFEIVSGLLFLIKDNKSVAVFNVGCWNGIVEGVETLDEPN